MNEAFDAVKLLVVFHTAGLIPQIAKYYTAISVQGTRNVLDA